MEPLAQAVQNIIKEQESIIGPIAVQQAKEVSGLQIGSGGEIAITGNKKEVLTLLIQQYEKIFGPASVQVCKDAIEPVIDKIPPEQIPDILR